MASLEIRIEPLSSERLGDYLDFFDRRAFSDNSSWSGCFCFFPYHDPASGDWAARSGEANKAAIRDRILSGRAQGYLALVSGVVVGWCNAAPRRLFPALARLPGPTDRIGSIPCFLVAPEFRGQGVARALLDAACAGLRARGLDYAEAKPVRGAEGPAANARGPLSLYLAAGFAVLHEDERGNIFVQKSLADGARA